MSMKICALGAVSCFGLLLASCGSEEVSEADDMGGVDIAAVQAEKAESGECTPETIMAKLGEVQRMAQEIPEGDPRFPALSEAGQVLQDELHSSDSSDGLGAEEALEQQCAAYDRFFAAAEEAGA